MADSATVEGVKEGLTNGHALLNRAEGYNVQTQGELDEMHYEDIAERLKGIVGELGALATKTHELPVGAAQRARGHAEAQYDRTFERTGRHPYIDALYANVGRMAQSHNSALENQRALGAQVGTVIDLLRSAVRNIHESVVPTREVLRECLKDANVHAEVAKEEGEQYRLII